MNPRIYLLLIVLYLTDIAGNEIKDESKTIRRNSYVCPPHFVRLGHRCYFFSRDSAPWQEAYFKCRDRRSNLLVLRNANQDKHVRRILMAKNTAPLERWIGGLYDWKQTSWKWASGKPLTYEASLAVNESTDKSQLRWHCLFMDPQKSYKWNAANCMEKKHFICHTKIKLVTSNKARKKLQKHYNANKYDKLNEVPIPDRSSGVNEKISNSNSVLPLSHNIRSISDTITFEVNNDISNGQFAMVPSPTVKRKQRPRKKYYSATKRFKKQRQSTANNNSNRISNEQDKSVGRRLRRKEEAKVVPEVPSNEQHIRWKTYKEDAVNPLYPRPIVDEYSIVPKY